MKRKGKAKGRWYWGTLPSGLWVPFKSRRKLKAGEHHTVRFADCVHALKVEGTMKASERRPKRQQQPAKRKGRTR